MIRPDVHRPDHLEADLPRRRRYGGLAADEYPGDERAPIVLLHGMTFDRTTWRPFIAHLRALASPRRLLALDLPGHGDSPARPSYRLGEVVAAIRGAALEARLEPPVLVGHSVSGLLATLYAARHPARAVVSVDQPPGIAPFVHLVRSLAGPLRGPGFDAVWARFAAGMHAELLPDDARALVHATMRARREVVLGYWQEILDREPAELIAAVEREIAAFGETGLPYLLVVGSELDGARRERLGAAVPQARVEVWAGCGHFPHLARPAELARRVAAIAAPPA